MKFKSILFSLSIFALACPSVLRAESSTLSDHQLEAKAEKKGYSVKQNSNQSTFRNTWTPYFTKTCNVQPKRATFCQANVAIGLLYFSDVRGNLTPNSNVWAPMSLSGISQSSVKTNRKIQGHLNYNRTPLYEFVMGYQWNNIIKTGLSIQSQTNVSVFTSQQVIPTVNTNAAGTSTQGQFFADLNLFSVALKGYFTFPFSLVVKMVSMTPYMSLGVGPCWQTWKRIEANYGMPLFPKVAALDLNQKISANAFFTMDLGFSTTWLIKNKVFKLVKGTRFNLWGQARSMGKARDQTFVSERNFLIAPLSIKTVYQFAPYIGLSFDF